MYVSLSFVRLIMFILGTIAVIVNTTRYIYRYKACGIKGKAQLSYTFRRVIESIIHNSLYEENKLYLYILIAFHVAVISLALSHIGLYIRSLHETTIQSVTSSAPEKYVELSLSIAMGGLGLLLLALRLRRIQKGIALNNIQVIVLHLIVQAIAWTWTAYYMTYNSIALWTAILAIEVFHVYMFTWAGFHGVMYILRLYYSAKTLRQPPVIELGNEIR